MLLLVFGAKNQLTINMKAYKLADFKYYKPWQYKSEAQPRAVGRQDKWVRGESEGIIPSFYITGSWEVLFKARWKTVYHWELKRQPIIDLKLMKLWTWVLKVVKRHCWKKCKYYLELQWYPPKVKNKLFKSSYICYKRANTGICDGSLYYFGHVYDRNLQT